VCNFEIYYLFLNVWGIKKRNEWLHPTHFPVSFLQEDCNCNTDARVVSTLHFLCVAVIAVGYDRWKEVQQSGAFRERCSMQAFHWNVSNLFNSELAEGWVGYWTPLTENGAFRMNLVAATPDQPAPCASWLPQQPRASDHLPVHALPIECADLWSVRVLVLLLEESITDT